MDQPFEAKGDEDDLKGSLFPARKIEKTLTNGGGDVGERLRAFFDQSGSYPHELK